MIVLDASAAIGALFNDGPARRAVVDQQLHVPHLIDSEIANAVRRQVAARDVAEDAAWSALSRWQRLGVTRYPSVFLLPRIWELRDNVSAYDATYIALAEELGCGLVTADARLGRVPGVTCPITIVPR